MGAGLLEKMLGLPPAMRASNPSDERFWGGGGGMSASGMHVTPETALTFDACFAPVAIIAEDTATTPVDVLRKRPGGRGRDELPDHAVAYLFNVQANEYQMGLEWREWMTRIAIFYPEAVSEIVPGRRGMAQELRPLAPATLQKQSLPSGMVRYQVRETGKRERYLGLDQVFRLPSRLGVGLIQLMRDDVGTALAANRTTAVMMKNGLTPRMALEHPGNLSADAQKRLEADVSQRVTGPENAGHIPIFEEGLKWIQIGIKPEDAQHLSQMEFSVTKMARWFRMQPHKIAYMVKASYASIEQQNIEHVIDTIRPWVIRWEKAADAQLLPLEPGTYLRHNLDALLRGDALSRNQALEIRRRNGVINANEWRELDDLNPRDDEGGEKYHDVQPGTGTASVPGSVGTGKARALAENAARRMVAKEVAAVKRNATKLASDWDGWQAWCAEFYGEHAADVARSLLITERAAGMYCAAKRDELAAEGLAAMERWEARDVALLAELSLEDES